MSNKKNVLIICLLLLLIIVMPGISSAVPAAPKIHLLAQPDGTVINARLWGDKWNHGWETDNGYTIVFEKNTRKWHYATHDNRGKLKASAKPVGKERPMNIKKHLRPSGAARAQSIDMQSSSSASIPEGAPPLTGTANIPVILINFSNTSTSYTPANFDSLLFGTGSKSMKDYYEEVSYGAFSVSSGPSGIAGWYTASNTHNYYGQNVGGQDRWPGTLVREAVAAADSTFDFAPYDQDGDCYVDVVNLVHQGSGEEAGGPSTDIWSHRWDLNSADYYGYSSGGEYTTNDICPAGGYIKINDYVIQPETLWGSMQTMGVFAHEYGHALGLPDLYDTDGSSEGIGNWGLMSGGSWNYVTRSGDTPAHMSAWSKITLGWVNPTNVLGTLTDEPIVQVSTTPDIYQILTTKPEEYFLVENRQRSGFDAGLPGSGLAIWHIDHSKSNNTEECDFTADCTSAHYKIALVQADGSWHLEKNSNRGNVTDMWYLGNASTFNAASTPNSHLYNTNPSNVSVMNISASSSTMTATLSGPDIIRVFSENFESGSLSSEWTSNSTSQGRIQVTTANNPYSGNYHLTMDDSVNAGPYSLNELILTIDLTGKTGAMLSFFQMEIGDEPHVMSVSFAGSENSDGIAISADGTNWYRVINLGVTRTAWVYSMFTADLDAAIASAGISYNSTFKIKFQQYDDYPINYDGFAFDDIQIIANAPSLPVPGTVTPSNTQYNTFVDSPFDLTTSFTDNDSNITSCEYCKSIDGNCDAEWTPASLSGSSPSWTCSQTGITGSNAEVLTLNMRATSTGGTGEGSAVTRTVDSAVPADGTLSAISGNSQVDLSWSGFSDSGSGLNSTDTYKLVYSTSATPSAYCTNGTEITAVTTETIYQHTGLTNGLTYFYRVCAIDAVSNISLGSTASITLPIQYQLTTSVSPVGSGSIVPDYSGGQMFDSGTLVILAASETSGYPFIDWTGCDSASNNICTMTMDDDKNLTAVFDATCLLPARNLRIPEYYSILQDAYDAAADGDTIQSRITVFNNDVNADRNISVAFDGGYNCNYSNITGTTTFNGTMTISSGTVTIGNYVFGN